MKTYPINQLNFKRAYTAKEKDKAVLYQKQAMELLGNKKVTLIVPETSLPVLAENIGAGQLNSKSAQDFFEFAKTYMGINSIKVLPQGEMRTKRRNFYCNYNSSALTLGSNMINLEELTQKEMGEILSEKTLKKVYRSAQKIGQKDIVNYENIVGPSSEHHKALKEAFENFLEKNTPEINNLKQKFEKYKTENSEILEKKSLFDALSEKYSSQEFWRWSDKIDSELFDTQKINNEVREKRIYEIKSKYAKEIEFSKFKQFLADENLAKAKLKMNENDLRLMGDCLIGFSHEETWGYPKAFEKANICSEDWGLRALKFSEIRQEGTESNKLLKLKVKQFAKRYDDIRFDVGWGYIEPILFPLKGVQLSEDYVYDSTVKGYRLKTSLNDDVIKIIENAVKSVKGEDYNLKNLIYEIEAGEKEFSAYDWNNNKIINALKGRTVVQSTCYMHNDYANVDFMEKRMKIPRENYVLMSGNHDHINLESLSKKIDIDDFYKLNKNNINEVFKKQIEPLAKSLNLSEETIRNNPKEFKKAKFAHTFLAQNIKLFFMDVFGRAEQFDSQSNNSRINYRYMIDSDFKTSYIKALEEEKGFNLMETLACAMRAKNLDKTHPDVYNNIIKYSEILKSKSPPPADKGGKLGKALLISTIAITSLSSALYLFLKKNQKIDNTTNQHQDKI